MTAASFSFFQRFGQLVEIVVHRLGDHLRVSLRLRDVGVPEHSCQVLNLNTLAQETRHNDTTKAQSGRFAYSLLGTGCRAHFTRETYLTRTTYSIGYGAVII